MFDNLDTAEKKAEAVPSPSDNELKEWDDSVPKDTWRNYSATGRLAILFSGVTFCVLFFPSMGTQWGIPVATLAAYSVLVFSLAFRDRNCSLHKPQVREKLPIFALMHVPFLMLVYGVEAEWVTMASHMPDWLTVRGRRGSFYEWILIAALCLIAWLQEHWMRAMIRRSLRSEESE
ncbi:MAG: hypothetical protein WB341_02910 [Terracidiphilus sp.]